ncbi:la-related protein 7 [Protopterus annectens]|uniref:la-related protein 7 n=1 Tax=Protopterus annectens TaxID=7888 RepID=UPI001CFA8F8D|nr:la-related protein 7 [Protopterus annectens]
MAWIFTGKLCHLGRIKPFRKDVDISLLLSFNKMKKLTTDMKLIGRALKKSTIVELNLEGTKLRRRQPVGEAPQDVDDRTVYVELLPKNVSHRWIERIFSKCGNVVYVSLPRYKTSRDPKGFAFVEFETKEQAEKAIELLNNPPEDAPRKPGIFPKTIKSKPVPALDTSDCNIADTGAEQGSLSAAEQHYTSKSPHQEEKMQSHCEAQSDQHAIEISGDTQPYEKEKKKRKKKRSHGKKDSSSQSAAESKESDMDASVEHHHSKRKRKRTTSECSETDGSETQKSRREHRKRDRSQSSELDEETKHKKRKRSSLESLEELDDEKKVYAEDQGDHYNSEEMTEPGSAHKDIKEEEDLSKKESLLKTKRKRKKKHKERCRIEEEVIPLRVLSKRGWLDLKKEYLTLQKISMSSFKKSVTELKQQMKEEEQKDETDQSELKNCKEIPSDEVQLSEKENSLDLQFVSGVIMKITSTEALPGKQIVKDALSEISAVAYVDMLDGDIECHVRFKAPEDVQKVVEEQQNFHKKYNWKVEVLSGDSEQRYWQKILVDRQAKLNRSRDRKRGSKKLLSKGENIILTRIQQLNRHTRFED